MCNFVKESTILWAFAVNAQMSWTTMSVCTLPSLYLGGRGGEAATLDSVYLHTIKIAFMAGGKQITRNFLEINYGSVTVRYRAEHFMQMRQLFWECHVTSGFSSVRKTKPQPPFARIRHIWHLVSALRQSIGWRKKTMRISTVSVSSSLTDKS